MLKNVFVDVLNMMPTVHMWNLVSLLVAPTMCLCPHCLSTTPAITVELIVILGLLRRSCLLALAAITV